jgi:hypothetical protein
MCGSGGCAARIRPRTVRADTDFNVTATAEGNLTVALYVTQARSSVSLLVSPNLQARAARLSPAQPRPSMGAASMRCARACGSRQHPTPHHTPIALSRVPASLEPRSAGV